MKYLPHLCAGFALSLLVGCAAEENWDPDRGQVDRADVASDGSFQFSFQEGVSAIELPAFACGGGEFCNFDLEFGLGDFPVELPQNTDLEAYGIRLIGTYDDFNGSSSEYTQDWSMPDLLSGGFGSITHSVGNHNGGGWSFKFRPTFDFDLSEGSIELTGFKFQGKLVF